MTACNIIVGAMHRAVINHIIILSQQEPKFIQNHKQCLPIDWQPETCSEPVDRSFGDKTCKHDVLKTNESIKMPTCMHQNQFSKYPVHESRFD